MPSSVEMWATGHAEMIADQLENLEAAYRLADLNPLGSAAGYGVPLPLDRARTSSLLGFARPIHNVFGASMARGENEAALISASAQLMSVLSTLTPREEMVLKLRFGLEDGRARTLEEVGKEFNVTRERIRQIEAKALRKLRQPSRRKYLKDFLE